MASRPVERLLQLGGNVLAKAGVLDHINCALAARAHRGIPVVTPEIDRMLPHDSNAFTQGLACEAGGRLFESTGLYSRSSLREIDAQTGEVLRLVSIPDDFAEDCALVGDAIYLLSWKSGRVRVFDAANLNFRREIQFPGEAWGLAGFEDGFLVSDGSCRILKCDSSFRRKQRLFVTSRGVPLRHLNALEKVHDRIYANVLGSNHILELHESGKLLRLIDCEQIAKIERPEDPEYVLNGIAWNATENNFYVTGKCWRNLFKIRLPY